MSMFPIASLTSSGSTGTFTFSNIPSTFSHLQVRAFVRSTGAATYGTNDPLLMRLNSDTGNNYSQHYLVGGDGTSGTSTFSGGFGNTGSINLGWSASSTTASNVFSVSVTDILDYSNTNKNKTIRLLEGYETNSANGFGNNCAWFGSNCWFNTDAVSSISIYFNNGGNFASGSRVDLYGISTSPATGA
jgi:hypothetical protein